MPSSVRPSSNRVVVAITLDAFCFHSSDYFELSAAFLESRANGKSFIYAITSSVEKFVRGIHLKLLTDLIYLRHNATLKVCRT